MTARWRIATATLVVAALLGAPGPLSTVPSAAAARYTEVPFDSLATDDRVVASLVRIEQPLPDELGAPRACDFIESERWRTRGGPKRTARADIVFVAIPGFLGGAGSFDQLARNTVLRASRHGRDAEFYALDRRANCLEDDHGIAAAVAAADPRRAYDYYWNRAEVAGRRFGGFETATSASFVGSFGLKRTMRDWNTVVKAIMPGRKRRARKLLCGGHSLGGPLTALFSSWDFDGDPSTHSDAGYKQCAGLFGLDTTVSIGSGGGSAVSGPLLDLANASPAPFLDVTPLTPETIQLTAAFGVGAYFRPDGTELIDGLPSTANIEGANRALFSRDAAQAATGIPDIRDFELSNETVMGGVFDDNSANSLSFIRASLGFLAPGRPLVDKNFPNPGDGTYALPDDPAAGHYNWDSYAEVGRGGREITANDGGLAYTNRESEISSLKQFSRAFIDGPINFIEQYFPTKLITDVAAAETGSFDEVAYNGPAKRPVLLLHAGDSSSNGGIDSGPPIAGSAANERPLSADWTLPGYNHLDVLTAARRQNDHRPEPTSTLLADWGRAVVKMRRTKPNGPGER